MALVIQRADHCDRNHSSADAACPSPCRRCRAGPCAPREPRTVLPSTATAWRTPARLVWPAAQEPSTASSFSLLRFCRVLRTQVSLGGHRTTPSAASTCGEALPAHCPIAVNERAPASTAHSATPRIAEIECRTPRRARGSGTPDNARSRPPPEIPWPSAAATRWATTGSIGEDTELGMAPRENHTASGTVMITPGSCPLVHLSPRRVAHHHRSSQQLISDFAGALLPSPDRASRLWSAAKDSAAPDTGHHRRPTPTGPPASGGVTSCGVGVAHSVFTASRSRSPAATTDLSKAGAGPVPQAQFSSSGDVQLVAP